MTARSAKAQPDRALSQVLLRGDPSGWLGWSPEAFTPEEVLSAWKRASAAPRPKPVQLYTHFAFCRMSCRFCQYWHVLAGDDAELERYTDHVVGLTRMYRGALGRIRVSNAYFGGGTPTALTTPMLARLLAAFRDAFEVAHEFTTEAHPSTLDRAKIDVLADGGINRISMGLQSFDEAVLHRVGRTNGPRAALHACVSQAQARGMLVNVDLILGLPGQTPGSFAGDLDATLALEPDTVTVYRYQPVHRLPEGPLPEMRFSRALHPHLAACAARRYVPFGPIGDGRYSVLLVRASLRTAAYLGRNVRSAVEGLAGREEPRRYTDVDRDDLALLGLGPGAVSHAMGLGWYRDVTAVRGGEGVWAAGPRYWGTRLGDEEETRSRAVLALGGGRWLDEVALRGRAGAGPVSAALEEGVSRGVLRRVLRWVTVREGVAAAEREAFLGSLLPARPPDRERAALALAFKMRRDVQPELVEIDREHRALAG